MRLAILGQPLPGVPFRHVVLAASLAFLPVAPGAVAATAFIAPASVPADAVMAPDGAKAAWPTDDHAGFWFVLRETGSGWSAPGRFLLRGVVRNPVFSPDGQRLAFGNLRGGHPAGPWNGLRTCGWSVIAVHDFAGGRISHLDPTLARDAEPHGSAFLLKHVGAPK